MQIPVLVNFFNGVTLSSPWLLIGVVLIDSETGFDPIAKFKYNKAITEPNR